MANPGKKGMRLRTAARSVSKGMEKEIKRKATRLSQDVDLALPRCTVSVPYFNKIRKELKDVQRLKDNRSALERHSKKGDPLVKAYAGTLLLLHEDKIPYLAIFKGPFGEVVYAMRGSTPPEKLVGLQNYDDPRVKLMAYLDVVKSKGLFMFVTENELICTGKDPKPPKEVLDVLPKRLGKNMRRKEGLIFSSDLDPGRVVKRHPHADPYLIVRWKSADLDMARSYAHSIQNKDNMYATCASYMASPKISQFFSVESVVKPLCDRSADCPCNPPEKKPEKVSFLKRLGKVKEETDEDLYLQGKIMDHRLIEKAKDTYEASLKEAGRRVYIIGNICLGDDRSKLIKAVSPKESELEIMRVFLELEKGPIISPEPSVNRMIGPFWAEIGLEILKRSLGDDGIASKVFRDHPYPRYQPMTVVEEGRYLLEERRIRKKLRPPRDPPKMIEFAYECAIAYTIRGGDGASRVLERYQEDDIKLKAAKYAFIKGLGLEKVGGWSYTTHEVGYAQGLDTTVKKLITKDPVQFREGLKELWKATGSTKDLLFDIDGK
ncbi:MAG: hypothetical protein QCI82_10455 [Candidatus Thermoplasmatota archaeon]|nr:hypothetical protein [Candidatus Thermoplasmatota archaeon]